MNKKFKKYTNWIKKHKIKSVLITLIIILALSSTFNIFLSIGGGLLGQSAYVESDYIGGYGRATESAGMAKSNSLFDTAEEALSGPDEYQIRKGRGYIKSDHAETDYNSIKSKAQTFKGQIDSIDKIEDYSKIRITTTVKVPSDNFDSFIEWLNENYDVEDINIELYKISVKRYLGHIEILLNALDTFERLEVRAEDMDITGDSLTALSTITKEKLWLMTQLNDYGHTIQEIEEDSTLSEITIVITEQKDIEIIPEDLDRTFMSKLRDTIDFTTNILMNIVTTPLVILATVLMWIVYALISVIPLILAYKIIIKIWKYINKKIK